MNEAIRRLRPGARAVTAAFGVSGLVHLARPTVFRPLMPTALPAPQAWIVGTGVAELVSAVGLLRAARWAPAAAVATLVVVWPGNVWHAWSMSRSPTAPAALTVALWIRLPLQLPMIAAARDPYRPEA